MQAGRVPYQRIKPQVSTKCEYLHKRSAEFNSHHIDIKRS